MGWASLTPTEVRTVALVAAGLTNPQIAERMFIARGTVKVHLGHVFAKLGVSTRSRARGAGDEARAHRELAALVRTLRVAEVAFEEPRVSQRPAQRPGPVRDAPDSQRELPVSK